MSDHIKNIAIVGAAGQVGKFIVDALLQKGIFNITAITRLDSPNMPVSGVRLSPVNYADPSTLVSALKGHDVLIITMSGHAGHDAQATLIRAAAEAGVRWIVPNEFGPSGANEQAGRDVVIGVPKKKDRELIEELGVSKWIGIACNFWYEYSLAGPGLYGIDIRKREVVWFDDGEQKIYASTWPQTGRAVAEVLSLPISKADRCEKTTLSDYGNKFVFVASFTLSQREMFESVKCMTKTKDEDWKISSAPSKRRFEECVKAFKNGNRMAMGGMLYTRYFFPDGAGLYDGQDLDNEKLGLPEEDLDQFTMKAVEMAEANYFGKIFGTA